MLKKRLIPKLQMSLRSSTRGIKPVLVVSRQFNNYRPIGDPMSQSKIYESQLVDELIFVDLVRSSDSWPVLLRTVELMSSCLATPLSVGGGVDSFDKVQHLLDRGADKVILNSHALRQPDLIENVSGAYGSQCLILSVDVKKNNDQRYTVWSDGGTVNTGFDPVEWALQGCERGAGEVMLTSIDHDGMSAGLDTPLISKLCSYVDVPVIASGGCGVSKHFVEGYKAGASAVSAGSFFCQRDQNPMQCRSHIRNAGIPIRIEV